LKIRKNSKKSIRCEKCEPDKDRDWRQLHINTLWVSSYLAQKLSRRHTRKAFVCKIAPCYFLFRKEVRLVELRTIEYIEIAPQPCNSLVGVLPTFGNSANSKRQEPREQLRYETHQVTMKDVRLNLRLSKPCTYILGPGLNCSSPEKGS